MHLVQNWCISFSNRKHYWTDGAKMTGKITNFQNNTVSVNTQPTNYRKSPYIRNSQTI